MFRKLSTSSLIFFPKSSNISRTAQVTRMFCSKTVAFDEVKKAGLENKALIIDVREPEELQETGTLPGSINIPLGEIESILKDCPPEQFSNRYGREKPSKESQIIFSCRSGKRSASAQAISEQLGFKCVKNYNGGWLDWEEKSK